MVCAGGVVLLGGLCSCRGPVSPVRAVIYASDEEAGRAMREAPLIVVVRMGELKLTGEERMVEKPAGVGGPNVPAIPLHLAKISAEVLLTVRGQAGGRVEFFSWVWASGHHGGPRLFRPDRDGVRVLFLRDEGGYLHTVGDYPSYDLELRPAWLPAMKAAWGAGQGSEADPVRRLVAARLRAELEGLTEAGLREGFGEDGPRVNHHWVTDLYDLVRVTDPYFVVSEMDRVCVQSGNPAARFAACFVTAQYFPGRCEGYRVAAGATGDRFGGAYLERMAAGCRARERFRIARLRAGGLLDFYGGSLEVGHRRETLRVYATAMDEAVRQAGCAKAESFEESRGLLECGERWKGTEAGGGRRPEP